MTNNKEKGGFLGIWGRVSLLTVIIGALILTLLSVLYPTVSKSQLLTFTVIVSVTLALALDFLWRSRRKKGERNESQRQ